MPEPDADPNGVVIQRVALHAILAGLVITVLKFGVFGLTNSVAILSDALESIINIVAAGVMFYSLWLSNRPADKEHPYGHGKAEFLAVGMEGWLILFAGLLIAIEAVRRLFTGAEVTRIGAGLWMLFGIGLLVAALAGYVWWSGRKYQCEPLVADGKHLMTDVASTVGVLLGLLLVRWTGWQWLDPVVAILVAGLCMCLSWRLLWQSIYGLMDTCDPQDDKAIRAILDDEKDTGYILGYHKVRHRHYGAFHCVDMHLQVGGEMSVEDSHALASRIEGRIEAELGRANATAHVEPYVAAMDPQSPGYQPDAQAEPAPSSNPDQGPDTPGTADAPIVQNDPL
jgi:cation diffusion facilitator family transporter